MRIENVNLMAAGTTTVDLSGAWISQPIYIGHMMDFAVQLNWTGSPTGTFSVQVSCDPENDGHGGSDQAAKVKNWSTLASPTVPATGKTDGTVSLADVGYAWIRISYAAGGTGTLTNARLHAKGL